MRREERKHQNTQSQKKSRKITLNLKNWVSFKSKIIPQGRNRGKGIRFKKHKPTNWFSSLEERRRHRALKHLLPEPTRAQAQKQQQQRHRTVSRGPLHDEYPATASATGWSRRLTTWLGRAEQSRAGEGAGVWAGAERGFGWAGLVRGLGGAWGEAWAGWAAGSLPGALCRSAPAASLEPRPGCSVSPRYPCLSVLGTSRKEEALNALIWLGLYDRTETLQRYNQRTALPAPPISSFPNKRPCLSNCCICPKSD